MNTVFNIGLHHFLFVSIILVGAGVATMLTKRNAIGILIGVELVLNAAGINLVAFNRYAHPERMVRHELTVEQAQQIATLRQADAQLSDDAALLTLVRQFNPDAVAASTQLWAQVAVASPGGVQQRQHVLTAQQESQYAALLSSVDEQEALLRVVRDTFPQAQSASWHVAPLAEGHFVKVRMRAVDGVAFAIFVIVLAAAETAVALAIFLNYYNNFSSIDVEKGTELKG